MQDGKSSEGRGRLTYADSGVDIDRGNAFVETIKPLVKTTSRSGVIGGIGGFGGVFDLKLAGYHDPLLVAATDGVGTKLQIAFETGNHQTVGIDLVAMCVNDLIVQGAEPLFFLDYLACGKIDPEAGAEILKGICAGCRQAGAALIGGETAEMPGMYAKDVYDLAGFAVGAVERAKLLPRDDLQAGDVLLGLASSGAHSNGFSLIRRLVQEDKLRWEDSCPFAPHQSLAEALLAPTRIYVPSLLKVLKNSSAVKALAHITGGGLLENIPRSLPPTLSAMIALDSFPLPPVFSWIKETKLVSQEEMLRSFNCGIGLVLVVAAEEAARVQKITEDAGETVFRIGTLIPRLRGAGVHFQGDLGGSEE